LKAVPRTADLGFGTAGRISCCGLDGSVPFHGPSEGSEAISLSASESKAQHLQNVNVFAWAAHPVSTLCRITSLGIQEQARFRDQEHRTSSVAPASVRSICNGVPAATRSSSSSRLPKRPALVWAAGTKWQSYRTRRRIFHHRKSGEGGHPSGSNAKAASPYSIASSPTVPVHRRQHCTQVRHCVVDASR
jgi:hypothetical protein